MNKKLFTLALASLLVVGQAAALDIGNVWKDGLDKEYPVINKSVADKLDFSASDTKISEKSGGLFNSLFSIVTGSEKPGPHDQVTFETTLNINDWTTACDNYIKPDGIQFDVWLEGEGVSKSGTKDTVYISCYGDGTADKSIDFNLPRKEGTFSYDFKVGAEWTDAYGNIQTWEQTVETDSVEVHVKDLVAKIDSTETQVMVGDDVTFSGDQSDGFAGIDDYEWYVDGQQVATGMTYTTEFNSAGSKEIKLRVSDYSWRDDYLDRNRWDSTTMTIDVVGDDDGDGIPNPDDKCENEAGQEEFDGCPDPDRDNDGIDNENDDCPDEEGVTELSGCPNDKPQIRGVTLDPQNPFEGEKVDVQINAVDLNEQRITYTTSYNGQTKSGSNPSFSFKSPGTKTLTIEVSDGIDSVQQTVDVQVQEVQTQEPQDPANNQTNQTSSGSGEDGTTGQDSSGESTDSTQEGDERDVGPLERVFFGFINWLTGETQ